MALPHRAPRFLCRDGQSAAPARLRAAALERTGALRDLRLVPGQSRPPAGGRGYPPRAVGPARAGAAETPELVAGSRPDVPVDGAVHVAPRDVGPGDVRPRDERPRRVGPRDVEPRDRVPAERALGRVEPGDVVEDQPVALRVFHEEGI